jgi:hypothetical protein
MVPMRVFLNLTTAIASLLLLSAASLHAAGVDIPFIFSRIQPSTAALAGMLLGNVHLFICSAYRRIPFYLLLAGANVLFFLPLNRFFHEGALIAASAFMLVSARWIASRPVAPFRRVFPAASFLTVVVLTSSQLLFSSMARREVALEREEQIDRIMASLVPAAYRYRDDIEAFIALRSGPEVQEYPHELIDELGRRIRELEGERQRFEEMKQDSLRYRDEIARLEKQLDELSLPEYREDDFLQVSSYAEAVRPRVPLVRDFSVKLAGSVPGSYYAAPGAPWPGETGIRQVLAIHRYLAGSWKYVNDPIAGQSDFISPADRTIALGLAGDCDDFAVLMASCVEAIGGRARILHGTCGEGAHAWCEVELGSRSSLDLAVQVLQRERPGRSVSWISPTSPNDYWLSLDWEAGAYSCGNKPVIFYQTGGGI